MREYIINAGGTEIMLPSDILTIDEMPKLGSGKCDYVSVDKIANNHFSSTS
jgi:acyl-coenzyme A synthetase/AMP-(fatty) acid ligase